MKKVENICSKKELARCEDASGFAWYLFVV